MSKDIRTAKPRKLLRFCLYLALTVLAAVAIAAVAQYICEAGEADDLYAITMVLGVADLVFVGLQGHRQWFDAEVDARVQERLREELRRHAAQLTELASGADELQRNVESLSNEMRTGFVGRRFPVRPATAPPLLQGGLNRYSG